MNSPFSSRDEIWFLHVCHHISNAVYQHVFMNWTLISVTVLTLAVRWYNHSCQNTLSLYISWFYRPFHYLWTVFCHISACTLPADNLSYAEISEKPGAFILISYRKNVLLARTDPWRKKRYVRSKRRLFFKYPLCSVMILKTGTLNTSTGKASNLANKGMVTPITSAVAYPGILFGGGFNKFSWVQRTERAGIWGR